MVTVIAFQTVHLSSIPGYLYVLPRPPSTITECSNYTLSNCTECSTITGSKPQVSLVVATFPGPKAKGICESKKKKMKGMVFERTQVSPK